MEHNSLDLGSVAGANIKRLMKGKGMTQEAFADAFGCDVRTVQRWVKGNIHDLRQLQQIAAFFGVDVFSVLSE